MARKSVNVQELKAVVNESLRVSTCSVDVRQGMIYVLEKALHMSGNYRGFQYLTADQVPAGEKPGIQLFRDTLDLDSRFDPNTTDSTRIEFI